jgi:beta-mannanase
MVAGGAANIVWVWNPSAGGVSGLPFWPGDAYVDWIGIDVYDRDSQGTSIFNTPYALYAGLGNGTHPMIMGETGSVAAGQTQFLKELPAALRGSYPTIKALVYFDGAGAYDYSLTRAGLGAFRALGADPYLSAAVP